jgi:hypothetical protein
MTRALYVSFALLGLLMACSESDDPGDRAGAGFLMLEYDQGPGDLAYFAASAQFATTEAAEPEKTAATHGVYASGGYIADGDCLAIGGLAGPEVLDPIDVGESVTATSGVISVSFDRQVSDGRVLYVPRGSDVLPYVDPSLARLGTEYVVSVSGGADMAAGEFEATLLLPTRLTGAFADQAQAGETFQLSADESFEVTWDPYEGAERVFVRFHDVDGAPLSVCMVPNTGSYTISPELLALQPAQGSIAVGYLYEKLDSLLDRDFQLVGSACQFGNYVIE